MMRHKNPNRLADRAVFWTALIIGAGFLTQATYDYGFNHGVVSCQPQAPKKLALDRLSAKAEARWVKYLAARSY